MEKIKKILLHPLSAIFYLFISISFLILSIENLSYHQMKEMEKIDFLRKENKNQILSYLLEKINKAKEFSSSESLLSLLSFPSSNDITVQDESFVSFNIFSMKNTQIYSSNQKLVTQNQKTSKEALSTLSFVVSAVYLHPTFNNPCFDVAIPILKENKWEGAFCFTFDLNPLYQKLSENYRLEKSGQYYIVQKNENESFSYISPLTNDLIDIAPLYFKEILGSLTKAQQTALEGVRSTFIYENYKGVTCTGATSNIPMLQVGLVIYSPYIEKNALYYFLLSSFYFFMVIFFSQTIYLIVKKTKFILSKSEYILQTLIALCFSIVACLMINNYYISKKLIFDTEEQLHFQKIKVQNNLSTLVLQTYYHSLDFQKKIEDKNNSYEESVYSLLKSNSSSISQTIRGSSFNEASFNANSFFLEDGKLKTRSLKQSDFSSANQQLIQNYLANADMKPLLIETFTLPSDKTIYFGYLILTQVDNEVSWDLLLVNYQNLYELFPNYKEIFSGESFLSTKEDELISKDPLTNKINISSTYVIGKEFKNEKAFHFIKNLDQKNHDFEKIKNNAENKYYWIYYSKFELLDLIFIVLIPESNLEFNQSAQVISNNLILLFSTSIILLTSFHLLHPNLFSKRNYKIFATITSFTFFFSGTLAVIYGQQKSFYFSEKNVLTNLTEINRFIIETTDEYQERERSPPIFLPLSLLIQEITFSKEGTVSLTGYTWINYPNEEKYKTGFFFVDAIESSFEEIETKVVEDRKLILSKFNVTLSERTDFAKFPIGTSTLPIYMQPNDVTHRLVMIPDLIFYQNLNPSLLPGIEKDITPSSYDLLRSFFSIEKNKSNLLIQGDVATEINFFKTCFHIQYYRKVLDILIIYFLPLFVILISTYAIVWVLVKGKLDVSSVQDILCVLAGYTALTFALILMQATLRDKFQANEIMFIEMFFFTTYFTITLLVFQSLYHFTKLLKSKDHQEEKANRIDSILILFWPLQFLTWFTLSYIIFF